MAARLRPVMVSRMTKSALLVVSLFAVGFGCTDDSEPETVCSNPYGDCKAPDASNDEVGDGDGDGDEPMCVTEPNNGVHVVHQCNGHMDVSLAFRVTDKGCAEVLGSEALCSESHVFGDGEEPYAMPAVMACCDADDAPADEVIRFCTADMVAQVCLSVSKRVESMIDEIGDAEGIPKAFKPEAKKQAKNLLEYIDKNQQACFDTLHKPLDAGVIDSVTWSMPNSKKWWALKDFSITIEKAVIASVTLPEEVSSVLTCDGNTLNDAEVFEERGAISPTLGVGIHDLAESIDVPIMGPRLTASARASRFSDTCSRLTVGHADRGIVLEDLAICADGPTRLTIGDMPVSVDGLSLRLYGAVEAVELQGNEGGVYVLDSGRTRLMVSGSIGGATVTRWAVNSDPIVLRSSGDRWVIEPFSVEHVDATGETWTANVPRTTWD